MMLDHCRYDPTIASYGRGTKLLPVPLTQQQFLDRLNATDSQKAMLWAM
jgi:hypothetical protein